MDDYKMFLSSSSLEEFHKRPSQHIFCRRPKILDIMETGVDGNVLKTKVNLKYFKEPKETAYPLDLNKGFENYKFRSNFTSLRKIEKYLMEKDENENDTKETCKIYAERSVLNYIMIMPYRLKSSEYNDLTIHVTKFNNSIYMRNVEDNGMRGKLVSDSYHFKFEQYCFSDEFTKEPQTDLPIDENRKMYCVYRTQLQELDIYYSGEINGVISDHEIKDSGNIEELNECRFVLTKLLWHSPHIITNFQNQPKTLNWWAQAYLGKTDDIYVGFKEKCGHIPIPIKHVRVRDLPKKKYWKPQVCNAFLHQFLTMMQDVMVDVNCPYTVFEFEFQSTTHKSIKYKIHDGKTVHSFLNEEFVQHMQSKK